MQWLIPGIGVKRWLLLWLIGVMSIAAGIAYVFIKLLTDGLTPSSWFNIVSAIVLGVICAFIGFYYLSMNLLAPYRQSQSGNLANVIYTHSRRQKGMKVVALGGGTGLPAVLRAMKPYTGNITAIVTVADDGGSSGRLRRDMGVLPPGDLRNNIVALADDESLMAQLFQYRFQNGDLGGHAFGNLFIAALSGVAGGLDNALIETQRVLNIQGRVLPSTLDDVNLVAAVRISGQTELVIVEGESKIPEVGGQIESISLSPSTVTAYPGSVQAILEADMVILGPGSLYTSILPNLVVEGIVEALRMTRAYKVYVCNVAMQPGETEGFTVAEHVMALERHIGRGVIQAVLANNTEPSLNAGENTRYVKPAPHDHEIAQRYKMIYCDLTDTERPWRHDPYKLAAVLMELGSSEKQKHIF